LYAKERCPHHSTNEERPLVLRNFKKFMKRNTTRKMVMTRRSHHKEDAMSAKKWATTLLIAHN
jgi:hypothetical protein